MGAENHRAGVHQAEPVRTIVLPEFEQAAVKTSKKFDWQAKYKDTEYKCCEVLLAYHGRLTATELAKLFGTTYASVTSALASYKPPAR